MWLDGRMQTVSEEAVGPLASAIVRTARHRAGMTQRRAAQRCGVSQSVFSEYERGARDPSLTTLRSLVGPLGFDLAVTLVRRVTDGSRLGGPIGADLRTRLEEVLAVFRAHGATRVWVVGRVVEGIEDPSLDGLHFHADLPDGPVLLTVMGEIDALFDLRYPVSVDVAYPLRDGGILEPRPPCVELTATPPG